MILKIIRDFLEFIFLLCKNPPELNSEGFIYYFITILTSSITFTLEIATLRIIQFSQIVNPNFHI